MNATKTYLQKQLMEEITKIRGVLISLEFQIKYCAEDKQVEDLQNTLRCARKLTVDLNEIVEKLDPDE